MTYERHNGWWFARVRVPEGPLNLFPGRRWDHYFEYALRAAILLHKATRGRIVLGEVGGKGGYDVRKDPDDAFGVLNSNRGGEVLFGVEGPSATAKTMLASIEEIFDPCSGFWEGRRRRQRETTRPEEWRSRGLPPCPAPREDWEPVYLRFGDPPASGRSRSWISGVEEGGVSVFGAYRTPEGAYLVDFEENTSLALHFLDFERAGAFPVLVVAGERAGTGAGGEPVLANISSCEPVPEGAGVGTTVELPAWFREWDREAQRLIPLARAYATDAAMLSPVHGPAHWKEVLANGLRLCASTPEADPHVAKLFAVLHDCQRKSDGNDPKHGHRARRLAKRLREGGVLEATDGQMMDLEHALYYHADGLTDEDPTVGACWDADRLDLDRCGVKPDPRYLSTKAAKDMLA